MKSALRDRYGFLFWLKWILWFCGSFILAAIFWTTLMKGLFGVVEGPELTMTWVVSVFGSWFILVIPFMRKKEQIWKRLNQDQEKAVDAWLLGVSVFIGLLVVSLFTWSLVFKERVGDLSQKGMDMLWAKSVFVSWLVILLPFLVFMYRKADLIFKTATERQTYTPKFKTISIPQSQRLLPMPLVQKLKNTPPTLRGGHVVTLVLKNGQRISHAFVLNSEEILGLYDRIDYNFSSSDVVDLETIPSEQLPAYDESKWLRLDGLS